LGFIREKRLYRFYLNGKDAFRLVLVVPPPREGDDLEDDDDGTSSDGTGVVGFHGAASDVSSLSSSRSTSRSGRSGHAIRRPRRHPLYRAIQVSPYSDEEDH
jgi:hypothetical protein